MRTEGAILCFNGVKGGILLGVEVGSNGVEGVKLGGDTGLEVVTLGVIR